MAFVYRLLLFASVAVLLPTLPAQAEDGPPASVVLILDASASMKGRVAGEAKITLAKAVVRQLIDGLPASTRLGLWAYGHRRKNDCKDVEAILPLGPLGPLGARDKAAVKARVDALSPRGHTPLGYSIQKTAEALAKANASPTIVLVTDGIETCSDDPCARVRALKAAGAKFTMHVVGFDVKGKKDNRALACIAEAGGGEYRTARDATELAVALQSATRQEAGPVTLEVIARRSGKRMRALAYVHRAAEKGKTGELVDYGQSYEKSPAKFGVEPGPYDVRVHDHWDSGAEVWVRGVGVQHGEVTKVAAEFDLGSLELMVKRNGKGHRAFASVFVAGTKTQVGSTQTAEAAPVTLSFEPGRYDVRVDDAWGSRTEVWLRGVEIATGKVTQKTVDFGLATLKLETRRNDKRHRAYATVYKAGTKEKVEGGQTAVSGPVAVSLPPGRYDVHFHDTWGSQAEQWARGVELGAGASVTKVATFVLGTLQVVVQRNQKGHRAYASVFVPGAENEIRALQTSTSGPVAFSLPPGTYDVRVDDTWGSRTVQWVRGVRLSAGKPVTVQVDFVLGTLLVGARRGAAELRAFVTVYRPGNKKAVTSGACYPKQSTRFSLPPGTYDIQVDDTWGTRKSVWIRGVRLGGGASVTKTASFPE